MGKSESDSNRNESPSLGNKLGAVEASLLESPIGVDALNAAKGFLLEGLPLQSAIRQAAVGALDRAGVSNDRVSHLVGEMEAELNKRLVLSACVRVLKKMISRNDMTHSELIDAICAEGVNVEDAERLAVFLYQKKERVWKAVSERVKGNVLDRLKERQTETQGETLGRILDELFKGGVRASTSEEVLAAWRKVDGGGNS
jgi:hypothetical protein